MTPRRRGALHATLPPPPPVDAAGAPRWSVVADRLEAVATHPSEGQLTAAKRLGIYVEGMPDPVAAAALRRTLRRELWLPASPGCVSDEGLNRLLELGEQAGMKVPASCVDLEELDGWFKACFAMLSAKHLRKSKPEPGDIFARDSKSGEPVEISSIADSGVVHLRGVGQRAHPNRLVPLARPTSRGYKDAKLRAETARARISTRPVMLGSEKLREIERFAVGRSASLEAINALEAALRTAVDEKPLQHVIEIYPELLGVLVDRSDGAWVIPQKSLGGEYRPDFLVAGIDSAGLRWTLVEIESPTAKLKINTGEFGKEIRHGMQQIRDWRAWLESNVNVARRPRSEKGLGLPGISTHSPGLVIGSRGGGPSAEVDWTRQASERTEDIAIHTYDWLLRVNRSPSPLGIGELRSIDDD